MSKKRIPLEILKIVEPLVKPHKDQLDFFTSEEWIYEIYDKDEPRHLYFKIQYGNNDSFVIESSPRPFSSKPVKYSVKNGEIGSKLENWLGIFKGYQKIESVFDDEILMGYYEELINVNNFNENDPRGNELFTLEEQLRYDGALDQLAEFINNEKVEQNKEEADKIIEEVNNLKLILPKRKIRDFKKGIIKIYAMMRKFSTSTVKDFISTGKTEAYKMIAKEGITFGVEFFSGFLN
ncbi:MAG: hypothetical protein R3D00_22685 [Bacteroidia bacterium]